MDQQPSHVESTMHPEDRQKAEIQHLGQLMFHKCRDLLQAEGVKQPFVKEGNRASRQIEQELSIRDTHLPESFDFTVISNRLENTAVPETIRIVGIPDGTHLPRFYIVETSQNAEAQYLVVSLDDVQLRVIDTDTVDLGVSVWNKVEPTKEHLHYFKEQVITPLEKMTQKAHTIQHPVTHQQV